MTEMKRPGRVYTALRHCEHACDQCGAAAATIEETPGGGHALTCARCGAPHGELPQTTITRSQKET